MNELKFTGLITEREVIRFTPAGLPIVNAVLQHSSQQIEAGIARLTEFEIAAVAAGEISGRFSSAPLGGAYEFSGFLARKSRNSKSLVFHIIDFRAA
ncbi:primosomal replication protein N [Pseudoduganella lutea]|uniref:Replication restart protein PriB n=1 Tax=Pseudoduganella lutea TaxID=321985 RepID=A0A4V0Z4L8_9BURK|nr:primosomal replication protein N [Pseudoduganella lutea]QBE67393.1 primosomal replication protein N [Pseudoduganella lutea]